MDALPYPATSAAVAHAAATDRGASATMDALPYSATSAPVALSAAADRGASAFAAVQGPA